MSGGIRRETKIVDEVSRRCEILLQSALLTDAKDFLQMITMAWLPFLFTKSPSKVLSAQADNANGKCGYNVAAMLVY